MAENEIEHCPVVLLAVLYMEGHSADVLLAYWTTLVALV